MIPGHDVVAPESYWGIGFLRRLEVVMSSFPGGGPTLVTSKRPNRRYVAVDIAILWWACLVFLSKTEMLDIVFQRISSWEVAVCPDGALAATTSLEWLMSVLNTFGRRLAARRLCSLTSFDRGSTRG